MVIYISIQQERVGQRYISNNGYWARCVDYVNANDITVKFEEYPIELHTQWNSFRNSRFRFPIGKYGNINDIGCRDKNGLISKEYSSWSSMFKRCYSPSVIKNRPTYNNKSVCNDWILYSNFLKWIKSQENYMLWSQNNNWCVDKDILEKGNAVYAPDKCLLVPEYINCLFVKCDSHRGKYPIGTHYEKESGKIKAQCRNPIEDRFINLGRFDTVQEAFYCYKNYKEHLIQKIAKNEYDNKRITEACYLAMMDYKVEITD